MSNLSSPFATQDLDAVSASLEKISSSADKVSKTLTTSFANAIASGKTLDQTLQSVALSLSKVALNAGLQPLQQGLSSLMSGAVSSLAGSLGGGASAGVTPFADGGIVSRPTFFGSGSGLGLMGERGAEAIVPLSRGPDGRLGLAAGGQGGATHVSVQIATPDPAAFRRSQVQVTSALARAVARGQRSL